MSSPTSSPTSSPVKNSDDKSLTDGQLAVLILCLILAIVCFIYVIGISFMNYKAIKGFRKKRKYRRRR